MNILTCTFSLAFLQAVPEIRKSAFEIEDKLDQGGYVKPLNIFPIPADAPYELPRLSTTTPKGHTTLSISAQNAQVQTHYDEAFSHDVGKSLDYSEGKASWLLDTMKSLETIEVAYAGVSAQVLLPLDTASTSPVAFIDDRYLKVRSDLPLSDAALKLVYEIDEDFYLNLEVKRVVLEDPVSVDVGPRGVTVTKRLSGQNDSLSISIDFNDRLASNEGRPRGCDHDSRQGDGGLVRKSWTHRNRIARSIRAFRGSGQKYAHGIPQRHWLLPLHYQTHRLLHASGGPRGLCIARAGRKAIRITHRRRGEAQAWLTASDDLAHHSHEHPPEERMQEGMLLEESANRRPLVF